MHITNHKISGVGLGLRHRHFRDVLEKKPDVPWFEVHTENFFSPHNMAAKLLQEVAEIYPLSAHCVGLSLGSAEEVSKEHLANVKSFADSFKPGLISDHVSWSRLEDTSLADLLPLPYTEEALKVICRNVDIAQDFLGRQILVENPSSYLIFGGNEIPEWEFVNEISARTGCGLLLDLNNIYVSAFNHGFGAEEYLNAVDFGNVKEVHLAGFAETMQKGGKFLIDDHGSQVYPEVWELFKKFAERLAGIPVLIEWDTNVPEFEVLYEEKRKAESIIGAYIYPIL